MKSFVLFALLTLTLISSGFSQILRTDEVDNTLVNQYGNELQALKKKYNLPTAFGFSKSITNRNGQLNETIIMWYVTESGETEDKIVSARILHYKEGIKPVNPKSDTTADSKAGRVIKITDTVTIVKRDTILMEEVLNPDSLTFKAKKVLKNKRGYVITGNIKDKGAEIPVVLNTFKADDQLDPHFDKRFSSHGSAMYNEVGMAVGTIFNQAGAKFDQYLIKVIKKNPIGWTNDQNNDCYSEEYIVPASWWNSNRVYWSWEKQLNWMRQNYGIQEKD